MLVVSGHSPGPILSLGRSKSTSSKQKRDGERWINELGFYNAFISRIQLNMNKCVIAVRNFGERNNWVVDQETMWLSVIQVA